MTRYIKRWTCALCKVRRSTKLRGVRRAPELVLRSTDFRAPENLIFRALKNENTENDNVEFPSECLSQNKRMCNFSLRLVFGLCAYYAH